MELIDTHVHLEEPAFDPDREQVIRRAIEAGVQTMINVGSSLEANQRGWELARANSGIYAAMGVHPHEFKPGCEPDLKKLPEQLGREKVVALGEIGLDYHVFPDYPAPDRKAQQAGFSRQLKLARIFELPLIIHIREAFDDALQLLRQKGPFPGGGVLHCYDGGIEHLPEVLDMGFHAGIGGTLTYPRAESARAAALVLPDDRVLLETDSPYLPPQEQRGKRNEPANVLKVAEAAARIKNISLAVMAEQTSRNARQLFKISGCDPGMIVYNIQGHLYINLTNRCSSNCLFCPRQVNRRVQNHELTLSREPRAEEVLAAIGDPRDYSEIVFCGFGEPLLRLGVMLEIARNVKSRGGWVRVDTNGQADMIFGRDILPECWGVVDEWSVSLNTADPEQYLKMVQPATGPGTHAAVVDFITRARQAGYKVNLTAVEMPEIKTA
ncbi:YchF/TatD family DNA exonuclease, partial [bacterium]|nr:YchF/TatD family DNA exonuclease [bacterium]